jgi:hypothetical protein
MPGSLVGRLLAPLTQLALHARFKMAQRKGAHLKVLRHGEALVAAAPSNIGTHLAMAKAAAALGLPRLAVWLAEQARALNPRNPAPLRVLARLHEVEGQLGSAVRLWTQVRQEAPEDAEARQKINDLAAQDTIERGNYKRSQRTGGRRGKPSSDD